eukprot:scaffold22069_cov122-Isochrysis_galbana.AAC.9
MSLACPQVSRLDSGQHHATLRSALRLLCSPREMEEKYIQYTIEGFGTTPAACPRMIQHTPPPRHCRQSLRVHEACA